jgi:hypothetical protein
MQPGTAWARAAFKPVRASAAAASPWVAGLACPHARAGNPTAVAAAPGHPPGRNRTRQRNACVGRHSGRIVPQRSASAATGIGGRSSSATTLTGANASVKFEMTGRRWQVSPPTRNDELPLKAQALFGSPPPILKEDDSGYVPALLRVLRCFRGNSSSLLGCTRIPPSPFRLRCRLGGGTEILPGYYRRISAKG